MQRAFIPVFLVTAIVSILPLWMGRYLPMVDLPQHAAQISIINHLNNPHFGFAHQFQLDWFVPYAFEYFMAAQLAGLVGIFASLKIAVSLAVLALPIAIYFLMKETGGDPWWSLIGFPLAYGFSFYWGFLSYIAAVPVGIFFLAVTYRYMRNPSLGLGVVLSFLGFFLFYSHAIAFLLCGMTAVCVSLFSRKKILSLVPLLVPAPFLLMWFFSPKHDVPAVKGFVQWGDHNWARFMSLFQNLLSNSGSMEATLYAIALIVVVIGGARFKPLRLRSYLPVVLSIVLYMGIPHHAMDISFIFQRLAVFTPIFLLLCLSPSLSIIRITFSRVLLSVMVLGWMGMLIFQFRGFNIESRDFDVILEPLKQNQTTQGIIFDNGGAFPFIGVFGHFPAYYQAFKGGEYTFSFGESYKSVARFKKGYSALPHFQGYDLTVPGRINKASVYQFNYFIIRSIRDRTADLKVSFNEDYQLVVNRGPWWVYEKKGMVK